MDSKNIWKKLVERLKKSIVFSVFFSSILFSRAPLVHAVASIAPKPTVSEFMPQTILVTFKPKQVIDLKSQAKFATAVSKQERLFPSQVTANYPKSQAKLNSMYVLTVTAGKEQEVVAQLKQLPQVAYAEQDVKMSVTAVPSSVPNDPFYQTDWQWSHTTNPWDTWQLNITNHVWTTAYWKPSTFVSAVLDTGIDTDHPDLTGQRWVNPREIANNGIDDDQNGYVDDVSGWNMYTNTANIEDDYGHGTQVAGVIAAKTDNGIGSPGLGWDAKALVIKVNYPGTSNICTTCALRALLYADSFPEVKAINMSYGGYYSSPHQSDLDVIQAILERDKTVLVAAAGNEGRDLTVSPFYPANYRSVVAVSEHFKGFRQGNYAFPLAIIAPGSSIRTTTYDGGFALASGTSIATPYVTGAAQLIANINPTLTASEIRQRLTQGASHADAWNADSGYGTLNIGNSIENSCDKFKFADTSSSITIAEPQDRVQLFAGQKVALTGTVKSTDFSRYSLEFAPNASPSSWNSTGMELANGGSKQVESGVIGSWTVPAISPGLYQVRVRAFGVNNACHQNIVAEERMIIDVVAKNIFTVSGKVTNSLGVGQPNVAIQFYLNNQGVGWVQTQADGTYSKNDLNAGTYKVRAIHMNDSTITFTPAEYNHTFSPGDPDKADVNFVTNSPVKQPIRKLPIKPAVTM